jgi:hypothetical protein
MGSVHFCPKCDARMEMQIDEDNGCGTFFVCPLCLEIAYFRLVSSQKADILGAK